MAWDKGLRSAVSCMIYFNPAIGLKIFTVDYIYLRSQAVDDELFVW